jgi:hypothetical protein
MRFTSLAASVGLCASLAFAGDGAPPGDPVHHEVREAVAELHHADGDHYPHAHGIVALREGDDFHSFYVKVGEVGGDVRLTVQLGVGDDHFADVGAMTPTSYYHVLHRTTLEGGHLPLDASAAHELSGRAIRILDGDRRVVLFGKVPFFEDKPAPEPLPEPKPDPIEKPALDIVAKAEMVRPEDSPYDASRGVIVAVKRAESEALRIEVGRLAPHTHYGVYLGDDGGGELIDDFTANDYGGASITRDTAKGDELPGGLSLADLAGRHVQIRHGDAVVLHGAIPRVEERDDVAPVHEDAREKDAETGATLRVLVDIRPKSGRERCDLGMTKLPTKDSPSTDGAGSDAKAGRRRLMADVFIDDGTGEMRLAGSAPINRRGQARMRFVTLRGRSLPLGVATLRELSGRAVQVRVNGVARVTGRVPNI